MRGVLQQYYTSLSLFSLFSQYNMYTGIKYQHNYKYMNYMHYVSLNIYLVVVIFNSIQSNEYTRVQQSIGSLQLDRITTRHSI